MAAATILLTPTCGVPTVQAAILIIGGSLAFARLMTAGFGGLFVIHVSSPFELT